MSPNLDLAIFTAALWHRNQVDKSGRPYILHPIQVMLRLEASGAPDELLVAAVLHDVVEDTGTSLDAVIALFGPEVGMLVDCLTKRPGEGYFDYIDRIKIEPRAVAVKLADLEENMRSDRGAPPDEKRQAKYQKAKEILMGEYM